MKFLESTGNPKLDDYLDFCMNKIDYAINSGTISFPKGLSHDERMEYISKQLAKIEDGENR